MGLVTDFWFQSLGSLVRLHFRLRLSRTCGFLSFILGAVNSPKTEETNCKSYNCFSWTISLRMFVFTHLFSLHFGNLVILVRKWLQVSQCFYFEVNISWSFLCHLKRNTKFDYILKLYGAFRFFG